MDAIAAEDSGLTLFHRDDGLFETLINTGWAALVVGAVTLFVASYVHAYAGFGFAMILMGGLTIIHGPLLAVQIAFVIKCGLAAFILPLAWKEMHKPKVSWLLVLGLFTMPIGFWLLKYVSEKPMTALVGGLLLICAALMISGWQLAHVPGKIVTGLVGLLAGLLNGMTAISGPPVIIYFYASPIKATAQRASVLCFISLSDSIGAVIAVLMGLLTVEALVWALYLTIPMAAGLLLGHRSFQLPSE